MEACQQRNTEEITTSQEFRANPALVDKTAAFEAYRGTSFDPEKRAEQAISGFAEEVQALYERLKPHAKSDAQKALLISEMERFQASYAQKYNELLYSHASIVSPMIAGPAKFPTERMRKVGQAYDIKIQQAGEWKDRAEKAILRALKELATEEAGGETEVIKAKIAHAEKAQEMMKDANVILRKSIPDSEKVRLLIQTGFKEENARELLKPDFAGRIGFSFQLTNNSAEIRRLKERLALLEKKEVTPTAEIPFTGGRIVDNREADRVQIFFGQKPPQDMINRLRSEGWHWSPSIGAWQRKRTQAAMYSASRITGAALPSTPAVPPPVAVAQLPTPTPTPLAAKPEERILGELRTEKPKVLGGPSKQELWEEELRRKALEGKKLRGQVTIGGAVSTAARLGLFEPGAMERAKAEAEARRRIEQLGLPYEIHPLIRKLAESTQEVLKFGSKRGKGTLEDIILTRYLRYCPPGAIVDNIRVPKVPERWHVYPARLRACLTEVQQKLASAGTPAMVKEAVNSDL